MSLLDFPSVTLYKQGAQHIQEWSIYVLDEIIYIEHGIGQPAQPMIVPTAQMLEITARKLTVALSKRKYNV